MTEQDLVLIQRRRLMVTYCQAFAPGWLYEQIRSGVPVSKACPYLTWPEERGRRPAMNYVKEGQVMFGPAVPDGEGELIVQVIRPGQKAPSQDPSGRAARWRTNRLHRGLARRQQPGLFWDAEAGGEFRDPLKSFYGIPIDVVGPSTEPPQE